MKYTEFIKENDAESDDELFGPGRGKTRGFTADGLPALSPAAQSAVSRAATRFIQNIKGSKDWQAYEDDAGEEDAIAVYDDFLDFRSHIHDNNVVAALGVLQKHAMADDWDETFLSYIERNSGVNLWDLVDMENPNVDAAYDHYRGARRIQETDAESDDELFGTPTHKKIAEWLHRYAVRMQQQPDHWSAFSADEDDEYTDDLAEVRRQGRQLARVAQTFSSKGMEAGLLAFTNEANLIDNWWWDRVAPEMWEETGISLEDLYNNMEQENDLGESEESDEELFGAPRGSEMKDLFNDHDEFELIDRGFLYAEEDKEQDIEILNDYLEEGGWDERVINIIGHGEDNIKLILSNSVSENNAELAEPPERPRKQDTKTKTKPDIKFDIPFQQAQDHPVAKADPLDDLKKKAGVEEPKVNLRKAKQKDTLSKTSGLGTPEMGDMLSKLRNIEIDPDLDAYPDQEPTTDLSTEVNTTNLPAVAGQALQAAGTQDPDFHQVANLPGNMSAMIRQLGKTLFGSFTSTPTKDIYMIANLGGQGPNTNQEVNAVAGFLKEHGDDRGPGDIDFDRVMPGYKAQTHMYSAAGIRWMMVKDFAGSYIYCWPESDSRDASPALGHNKDIKKLK